MEMGVARKPNAQFQAALDQYTTAMKLFGQQKFDKAKPLLEKVRSSGFAELAERAGVHLITCDSRLHPGKSGHQSAEDYYQQAVVRLNTAHYQDAEELLNKAVKAGGIRPHYAYALACLRALTNEPETALVHLREAIAGDPRCRQLARTDADFDNLGDDPRFTELLYPERD